MEVVDSYVSPNVSRNYMWKAKKEKPDGNLVHGLIPKFRYLNLVFIQLEDMHWIELFTVQKIMDNQSKIFAWL